MYTAAQDHITGQTQQMSVHTVSPPPVQVHAAVTSRPPSSSKEMEPPPQVQLVNCQETAESLDPLRRPSSPQRKMASKGPDLGGQ